MYIFYEKDDNADWTHWGIEVAGTKVEKVTGKETFNEPSFYGQKVVKIPITELTPLHKQRSSKCLISCHITSSTLQVRIILFPTFRFFTFTFQN